MVTGRSVWWLVARICEYFISATYHVSLWKHIRCGWEMFLKYIKTFLLVMGVAFAFDMIYGVEMYHFIFSS